MKNILWRRFFENVIVFLRNFTETGIRFLYLVLFINLVLLKVLV